MNVTTFALTTMFKIFSNLLHSLFPIPEKSQKETQDEITVPVKKTQSNSKSLVNNSKLKLKEFDSNLQYNDKFKKNQDSTIQYTRTFYRNPLFQEEPGVIVGTTVGTLSNQQKNGRYEQKFNILYLFDNLPEIFIWDVPFQKSLQMTETGTYVDGVKEGSYTILYTIKDLVVCTESGTYKNDKKEGPFHRQFQNPFPDTMYECLANLEENGTFYENKKSNSLLEKRTTDGKLCYKQILKKTIKYDKRQIRSALRIVCDYTIESNSSLENGCYHYSFYDIQFYMCYQKNLWRRGEFFYENKCPTYNLHLESVCRQKQFPTELQGIIQSFLTPPGTNKKMGVFSENHKLHANYNRKVDVSDDGKYIHIHNVRDWSDISNKKTLTFEKELLWNSPLFDNETFCSIGDIAIGFTSQSKYYEPIFKFHESDTFRSVLRFLFYKKGFRGHIIFINGNRNFISYDNVKFISKKEFSNLEGPVTGLQER